jgi:fluoride exporter
MKFFYLLAGGIAGTFARYFLSGAVYEVTGTNFPYGTLIVNLTGCFAIGVFASLADEKFFLGPDMKLLLMAGFCGAFTTFSTFILETSNLVKDGENLRALGNILASVVIGFAVFRTGYAVGRLI